MTSSPPAPPDANDQLSPIRSSRPSQTLYSMMRSTLSQSGSLALGAVARRPFSNSSRLTSTRGANLRQPRFSPSAPILGVTTPPSARKRVSSEKSLTPSQRSSPSVSRTSRSPRARRSRSCQIASTGQRRSNSPPSHRSHCSFPESMMSLISFENRHPKVPAPRTNRAASRGSRLSSPNSSQPMRWPTFGAWRYWSMT